jgi:hypothetical protein
MHGEWGCGEKMMERNAAGNKRRPHMIIVTHNAITHANNPAIDGRCQATARPPASFIHVFGHNKIIRMTANFQFYAASHLLSIIK